MATAEPTLEELRTQRAEIDRQIAIANLDGLKAIQAALKSGKVATLATDLEALLAYEESTKARAPYQTLLANRITRASAK